MTDANKKARSRVLMVVTAALVLIGIGMIYIIETMPDKDKSGPAPTLPLRGF